MKKKSPRGIPDFARQPTQAQQRGAHGSAPAAPPVSTKGATHPATQPAAKPQATSSKSGRRGQ